MENLFEWMLFSNMLKEKKLKQALAGIENCSKEKLQKVHYIDPMTDLRKPQLAYNSKAQLNLADVKPVGFLIKSTA